MLLQNLDNVLNIAKKQNINYYLSDLHYSIRLFNKDNSYVAYEKLMDFLLNKNFN